MPFYLYVVVKERSWTSGAKAFTLEPGLQLNRLQVVGVTGFEPVTLRLSSACSNQLSYTPGLQFRCPRCCEPVGGGKGIRTPDL